MSISEPYVTVTCDVCGETEEIAIMDNLSDTVIEKAIEDLGWRVTEDEHLCEFCAEEASYGEEEDEYDD